MPFEEYNPTVMDHFLNPRNTGEVATPTHTGVVTNPVCGDMMKLTLRVSDGTIREARAKTFGCAAAIACSSALTELLLGRTVADARSITNGVVVERLGGLPENKVKCSLVAEEAVRKALA
jgi:NifU-like protein involved in Fe-S cluster formation